MCRAIGGERRSEGGGYLVRGLARWSETAGGKPDPFFKLEQTHSSRWYCCTTLPSAEATKHTRAQGYMATACDRSQVKEVVGVVPLVLLDGKSSCSRGRRVKLESRQGGEPFSELLVFQERTKSTG